MYGKGKEHAMCVDFLASLVDSCIALLPSNFLSYMWWLSYYWWRSYFCDPGSQGCDRRRHVQSIIRLHHPRILLEFASLSLTVVSSGNYSG
jgi:hypothetical protein